MGRGLGPLQRKVIVAVEEARRPLSTVQITDAVGDPALAERLEPCCSDPNCPRAPRRFPSRQRPALHRSVQRALQTLVRRGKLVVVGDWGTGGSNVYAVSVSNTRTHR